MKIKKLGSVYTAWNKVGEKVLIAYGRSIGEVSHNMNEIIKRYLSEI